MKASDLDYALPEELIAQEPPARREDARMLIVSRAAGTIEHGSVRELPRRLPERSLLVVNDTRVIPARLHLRKKATGGSVELLLIEPLGGPGEIERWRALARSSKGLRAGQELEGEGGWVSGNVIETRAEGEVVVDLAVPRDCFRDVLEHRGSIPLPPYIRRTPDARDRERYQTVFATQPGAVAAPTAGLHLGEALLAELAAAGHELARVTLHVGPGTFAPLRTDSLAGHRMHEERYEVSDVAAAAIARAREAGRPVAAVGTTVVRTLESAALDGGRVRPGRGTTAIFIYPPYDFRVVDVLLTNFHLPRSTLLALVMAFGGEGLIRRAYEEAVRERYRFFSYGDAMLVI